MEHSNPPQHRHASFLSQALSTLLESSNSLDEPSVYALLFLWMMNTKSLHPGIGLQNEMLSVI